MSMNIPQGQSNRSRSIGTGAVLGIAGMSAYYLPVKQDRFIRSAFNVVKNDVEDKVELLKESAIELNKNRLSPENKIFLAELGVAEDTNAINTKIQSLLKSVTDKLEVKNLKQSFADGFKDFKNSEVLRDAIASKAFKNIKWANFAWGTGIGFVLGAVLGARTPSYPQFPIEQ